MKNYYFSALIGLALIIPFCISADYKWYNTKIGGGGFVTNLVYNPAEKGLLYLRTDMGGSYRYEQDTKSWTPIQDVFSGNEWWLFGCESIGVDTKEPNRVYVAAGTYMSYGENGAIIGSDDYGKTWTTRWDAPFHFGANDDGRGRGERLAVNPENNNIIYFGTRKSGLYMSSDYGKNFEQVKNFPSTADIPFVLFAPGTNGKTMFVATDSKSPLYRSDDGGKTFTAIADQPTSYYVHHGAFSADNKYLYLTYSNSVGPNGATEGAVYRMTVSDNTFKLITPAKGSHGYAGVSTSGTNPGVVIVSTLNLWWPSDEVFKSSDYGETWSDGVASHAELDISEYPWLDFGKAENLKFGWWIAALAMDPYDDSKVSYGTGATVYTSTDFDNADSNTATHWKPDVLGFEECAINDIEAPPSGNGNAQLLTALGDLGGFTQDNIHEAVEMWTNPTFTSGSSVEYAYSNPQIVVAAGTDNASYSTDGGHTWNPMKTLPYEGATSGIITISGDAKVITWAPNQSPAPYWTSDFGATWTKVTTCPSCTQIRQDGIGLNIMYGYDYQSLYISKDGGKTYTKAASSMSAGQLQSPFNVEGHLWLSCTYWGGVQRSTDYGATFEQVPTQFTSAETIGFGKPPANSNVPYAVYVVGKVDGYYGVYRSLDLGDTWELLNDDQHQWGVYNSKIIGDPNIFGRVYIATNGRGVVVGDDLSSPDIDSSDSGNKTTTRKTTTTTKTKTKTTTTSSAQPTSSDQCFSLNLTPSYPCCSNNEVVYSDENGDWGFENNDWCGIGSGNGSSSTECFSIAQGFPCCVGCNVVYVDESGEWGFENNDWCGITPSCSSNSNAVNNSCPGASLGYTCCNSCKNVLTSDEIGNWSVENNDWCSIPYNC